MNTFPILGVRVPNVFAREPSRGLVVGFYLSLQQLRGLKRLALFARFNLRKHLQNLEWIGHI